MNFRYYKTGSLILFILVFSVAAGVLMTNLINPALDKLDQTTRTIIDYIGFLSVPALVGSAILFVDKIGWRWGLFRWLVDLPDMRGRYEGTLNSTYHEAYGAKEMQMSMVMEIHQTASEIVITCFFSNSLTHEKSYSRSVVEQIEIQRDDSIKVTYLYVNKPDYNSAPAIGVHEGTVYFIFYPDTRKISGGYYTERPSNGTFEVEFKSAKLLHRFER